MLKIKKTKPYQHSSVHIIICAIALICGIVPSLALLTYYNPYTESTYAARKTLSNITTMQEMTTDICNNSALGQSNTLIDIRDNSTYTVARLSDGNCWMTQNLRLTKESLEANGHSATISSSDSNVISDYTIPANGVWSGETGKEEGVIYAKYGSYSSYYTWCTATAGTCVDSGTAVSDICPKNWRLPTGGNDGEYQKLVDKGYSEWTTVAGINGRFLGASREVFFPAAGAIRTGEDALSSEGSAGSYWGRTAQSETMASNLYFSESDMGAWYSGARYAGRVLRCLTPASNTDFPELFDEKDSTVSVTVPKVLTIDAISKALTLEANPNQIIEGNISATISANTTYSVQLSAENPDLTNPNDPDHTIPASTNVQKGENAWGILNQDNSTYSAITSAPTTYHNAKTTNEDSSKTHTFTLSVSISPTLPAGEYSTTVTITAVNN